MEKKKRERQFTATDFYATCVLVVCYGALDVVYPLVQFSMGMQLSDWWLAANIAITLVELVCLVVIKVSKGDKTSSKQMARMLDMLVQVVGALAGASIQLPSMTSGEREDAAWGGDTEDVGDDADAVAEYDEEVADV